jgi:transcription termination factor Rho
VRGTRVEEMDADFPSEPLTLAASDETLAAVDAAAPFGRGSRVVLAGPPRSGRSELIRRIAAALGATAGLEIELLVVGARPEEVSELRELEHVRAAALSFAAPSDAQDAAVEQAVERGRRIAVRGGDALLLIDALDGVGAAASRRALASARNLRGAGSLTIIAAARAPIGGESTLITLRRDGQFPALDAENSWTVRAELLLAAAPKPKPKRARAPRRKPAAAAEAQDGE